MNNTNKNYIFVNAFYNGFIDKNDCNHIGFFESIFKNTKLSHKIQNNSDFFMYLKHSYLLNHK